MFSCSESREALAENQIANELPFVLSNGNEHLRASGIHTVLRSSDMNSAPSDAREFFHRKNSVHAPPILVGALPFRHDQRPYLLQPVEVAHGRGPYCWPSSIDRRASHATSQWIASADPSRDVYERMVAQALERLAGNTRLRKVVLGRRLILESVGALHAGDILRRLASDRDVTTFAVPLPDYEREPRLLIGATPELLLEKSGEHILSLPLAGSAPRSADPAQDREAAEALLRSEKDRREHALVVESVIERLAPFCRTLRWADEPALVQTATMWHLGTRIDGESREANVSSLDLAVALHPTAAVCGVPGDLAAETIAELEMFDRGYFAGAVGWCNAEGDGRWMVTIRCAELSGNRATLFAGAGIVSGSDPRAEATETSAKFQTMLRALAVDEAGRTQEDLA